MHLGCLLLSTTETFRYIVHVRVYGQRAAHAQHPADEVRAMKANIAALQNRQETVEGNTTETSSETTLDGNAMQDASTETRQPWSTVVRRGRGQRSHRRNDGSSRHTPPNPTARNGDQPSRAQGEDLSKVTASVPAQTESQQDNGTVVSQNSTLNPGANTDVQKVRACGVRRVWGTVKSCSSTAVKNTVSRLISAEAVPQIGNITVKRKYKRLPGNKIRWWFLLYMDEDSLQKLESEWEKVSLQTSWKLEPCHAPANFLEAPPLVTPDLDFDFPPSVEGENSHSANTHRPCPFSILYYNARSLLPKMDELRLVCLSEQPDIVCIVETWLGENILDSEISIANYSVVRLDRNRHGGGIVMYIRDCLHCSVLNKGTLGLELAIVTVTSDSFTICIGLLYRPPSSPVFVLDSLFSVLESLDSSHFSNFVLIGDFNIDYNNSLHPLRQRLDTIISSFSLAQVVADPTHTDSNGRTSLIDLALLSSPENLSSCSVIPPLENSTYNVHSGIRLKMKTRSARTTRLSRRTVWRYTHADFEKANRLIESLDMNSILDSNDIELLFPREGILPTLRTTSQFLFCPS